MIKTANTNYPVLDLIRNRWSNRAFDTKAISENDLKTLFEAASWAPSANNEQPWQYFYAQKNDKENFEKLLSCLVPGNQVWAKNADTIIACVARKTFEGNGKNNPFGRYDLGSANQNLLLQAHALNIYGHVMAGFDSAKAVETLHLNEFQEPVTFIVLGYLGDPETLEEPFKQRELTPRTRKPIENFITKI